MKATNEFHNPIGAFRRKVDYNHGTEVVHMAREQECVKKAYLI